MLSVPITGLYAGLQALIAMKLIFDVGQRRGKSKVSIGDGGDPDQHHGGRGEAAGGRVAPRAGRSSAGLAGGGCGTGRLTGPRDRHGPRPSIRARGHLVGKYVPDLGRRRPARPGRDVHEHVRTGFHRPDEAEAAVRVPLGQGAFEAHGLGLE